jgi:hypothetical protein
MAGPGEYVPDATEAVTPVEDLPPPRVVRRVRRLKHLGQRLDQLKRANWETAVVFLDDGLLPSTSTAVERGKRRCRKAHQRSDSVRPQQHLDQRIGLDRRRELRVIYQGKTFHRARSGN